MEGQQGGWRHKWTTKLFFATPFWFGISIFISLILCLFAFFGIKSDGFNLINTAAIVTCVFTVVFFTVSYSVMVKTLKQSLSAEAIQHSANPTSSLNIKSIMNLIPPTNPNIFEQRSGAVEDIYKKILQGNATIFVLTGIVGCGKTTVAALICRYSEGKRISNLSPFTGAPIWLEAETDITISHITKTLLEQLGETVPELNNMTPQMQANMLITKLNEIKPKRLIVLDQFDKLLDFQTGRVQADGIGEWLDNLLSEQYSYKVLLTSRCWPLGPAAILGNERNKYVLEDLEDDEAEHLLLNQGGKRIILAQPDEFQKIFTYCDKHVWALKLLADILRNYTLSLSDFLSNDNDEIGLWFEQLAHSSTQHDIDIIYNQLLPTQQKLVRVFSIFRKPIALDAASALMNSVDLKIGLQYYWENITEILLLKQLPRLSSQLGVLIRQHLLKVIENSQVNYQLHQIFVNCVHYNFVARNVLQVAHGDAARYYAHQVNKCRSREKKQATRIEEIWHLYKAGYWQKAYVKLKAETIYSEASSQSENMELRKLYLEILSYQPLDLAEEAFIFGQLGKVCKALRNNIDALIYSTKSHELFEEIGDQMKNSNMLRLMSEIYATLGDLRRAQECQDEADNIDPNEPEN